MIVVDGNHGSGGWFFFKVEAGVRIELHQSTDFSSPIVAAVVVNEEDWKLIGEEKASGRETSQDCIP